MTTESNGDTYLQVRNENMERNKRFLNEIGLIPVVEKKQIKKGKSVKNTSVKVAAIIEPSRRSLRIAEIPPPSYKVILYIILIDIYNNGI
jgi:hypothetical protein